MLSKIRKRLFWILAYSETATTRFWFAWASIGFSSFLFTSNTIAHPGSEYRLMVQLAPPVIWAWFFLIHGLSLLFGVATKKYNRVLLITEGIIGTAVWVAAAIAIHDGAAGGSLAGAFVAIWLLIRYPTHHEWNNAS